MPTTVIQRHAEYDPATTAAIGGITGMVEGDRVYDTTTGIPQYRSAGAAWERYTVVLAGQVAHPVGLVGAPSITYDGDPDSGFFLFAPNDHAAVANGLFIQSWTVVGVTPQARFHAGSATTPSISFFSGGDTTTGIFRPIPSNFCVATGGVERMRVGSGGIVFIGNGTTTTNANMTIGLDIDQLGNDDEILALRSSTDVTHGVTDITETDVYLSLAKAEGNSGGVILWALKDAGGLPGRALRLFGVLGEAADTAKTTAANSIIQIQGFIQSGTGVAGAGADQNVIGFGSGSTSAILDAEGTWHLDLAGNGTAAAPSLTFAGRVNSGLYSPLANQVAMSAGGVIQTLWASTGIYIEVASLHRDNVILFLGNDGDIQQTYDEAGDDTWNWNIRGADSRWKDAAIAAFAAGADLAAEDTFWRFQDGGVSTGVGRAGGSFTATGGDGSAAAVASGLNGGVGGTLNLVPGDGGAGDGAGVAGADGQVNVGIGGSQTIPAFIIDGDVDTGWYLDSPNTWRFSANGADLLDLSPFRVGLMLDGTKTGPSLGWDADPNVGLYRPAADQLGLTAGGAPLVLGDAAVTIAAANNTNGADVFTKVEDGGTATGATAGFIGADLTWETGDGSAAGGGVNPGGAAGNLNVLIGVGGAGAGGGGAGANGQVIFDLSDSSDSPDLVPGADDEGNVGLAGTRWSLIRGVAVTSGDLNFENGWTFTEAWDDGTWGPLDKDEKKGTKGLYIFNHRKQRVAWLDNEGNIHARGRFIEGWVPA